MRSLVVLTLVVCVLGAAKPRHPVEPYVVNLDLPPEDRWTHIIKEKLGSLELLFAFIKPMFNRFKVTGELIAAVNSTISEEYAREMQGIAKQMGKKYTYADVLMANMFYELSGVDPSGFDLSRACTSMVTQRSNGTVYLARNQDYPPPFTLVMIHAIFTKNNKTVYQGTTYAGTIGLSTGVVFGASGSGEDSAKGWGVSINARSNPDQGTPKGEQAAVEAARRGAAIFPIFTRMALDAPEVGASYASAIQYFSTKELIMPGYLIVAGGGTGEGSIVTRNATTARTDVFTLFNKKGTDAAGGDWYVVETNTDHWMPAPIFPGTHTSRRGTATKGLDNIGKENIDLEGMWDVLDTYPTFNPATIHTDLVGIPWGEYRTYKRNGPLRQ